MSDSTAIKGRFAPSPTGRMHLGNAMTALLSWLCAKSQGGQWLLRIEDLDPERCKRKWAELLQEDLLRLGLEWDEGGLNPEERALSGAVPEGALNPEGSLRLGLERGAGGLNPPDTPSSGSIPPRGANAGMSYCQSERSDIYASALKKLEHLTYPCYCTRADILAAGAPHESDGRVIYSGKCRSLAPQQRPSGRRHSIRIEVPDKTISFDDLNYGAQSFNLRRDCGDFILRRSDGGFAYQLAVVVDDALMGVTQVVRGRDLLLSTAQQIFLYESLGFDIPSFCHLPLLCNSSGRRLSKRDIAMDLGQILRRHCPEEIIGRMAYMCGIIPAPEPCMPKDLTNVFRMENIPSEDIIIRDEVLTF